MALADEIRQRGHWFLNVRPRPFHDHAMNHLELEKLLRRSSVELRGWDFPHVDGREPIVRRSGYIEQATMWKNYLESWRFFESGQFADRVAMVEDWWERAPEGWGGARQPQDWESRRYLGITEAVFRLTEFLVFSARLAAAMRDRHSFEVVIAAENVGDRHLYVDDPKRAELYAPRVSREDRIEWRRDLPAADLIATSRDLALDASLYVFGFFGWDADRLNLAEVQAELRS